MHYVNKCPHRYTKQYNRVCVYEVTWPQRPPGRSTYKSEQKVSGTRGGVGVMEGGGLFRSFSNTDPLHGEGKCERERERQLEWMGRCWPLLRFQDKGQSDSPGWWV